MLLRRRRPVVFLVYASLTAALLGGCAEISLKQGATAEDLKQAKAFCRENKGVFFDEAACLKDQGWTVLGGDSPALAEDEVIYEEVVAVTDGDAGSVTEAQAMAEGGIAFGTTKRRLGLFPVGEESVSEGKAPSTTQRRRRIVDPTSTVAVNSWWKVGADGRALLGDGNLCLDDLGDGYSANGNFSRLSYGVVRCLREKGWRYQMTSAQ